MSKDWMLTHTRKQVYPLAFKAEDVHLDDIANSLAKQCRYNGHVDNFYSVAEHSVLISLALERDGYDNMTQFTGLHHDDAECYTGDIIKPLKNALADAGLSLKKYELDIEEKISQSLGMDWPWPEVVHGYDRMIVRDEKDALKRGGPGWEDFGVPNKGLGVRINCWDWQEAAQMFLNRHNALRFRARFNAGS
tara:strand:- start:2368 stop:2943 length:576 start_codon:yes stop_codon:yes gene_type:complete